MSIENLLSEDRSFPPDQAFTDQANAQPGIHEEAASDPAAYWLQQAQNRLEWVTKPTQSVDESNAPFYKWFSDGELNVSANCLDRHLEDHGDQIAYHWIGEPGDTRDITYAELHADVCRMANGLKSLGLEKGDRVAIYMGMIPELPVAMLACARLGLVHSVIFGGFSSDAISDRVEDGEARVLITQDGAWRGGKTVPLKANADVAVARTPVEKVVVVKRAENDVHMEEGRDIWWHDLVDGQDAECDPVTLNAEDPLYILYTSGTTGKPKGIVHTQGGYLTGIATTHWQVFDLKPDKDVYWCAADIGWVTGHSYIVYGPLANRATSVIYEGAPNYPKQDRLWEIIEDKKVTIFYTAPTAIRAFMKWGDEYPNGHDLSSLRLIGTVGEPINPEAWMWYQRVIGGGEDTPVVDTWWQTETGMIMISPLPGITATKPGSATLPLPGVSAEVVDDDGNAVEPGGGGFLTLTKPWPAMARTIWGDDDRFVDTYWSRFPGRYFPGDGAKIDEEEYFWLLGRVDDVMLVSGHNISTTEVESALVSHPAVAEAAVVGRKDELTGQAIAAFVSLRGDTVGDEDLLAELRQHVSDTIGPIAKPKSLVFTDDLPKTRSGKIMRRLLKDISENRQLGDVTTLANQEVVDAIAEQAAQITED